jgi:hypothetical protein
MNTKHSMPSKSEMKGHARRAQERIGERFGKMMKGDKPQDHFVQAMTGAVCAAVCVRLIRATPIGAVLSAMTPFFAFAALYQRLADGD